MKKNLSITLTPTLISFIIFFMFKNAKAQQYINYNDSINMVKNKYDMIDKTIDKYSDSVFTITSFFKTEAKIIQQSAQTLKTSNIPEDSILIKKLGNDIKYLQTFCQDIYDIEGNNPITAEACKYFSNMCRNTEISRFNRLAKRQERYFDKLTNNRIRLSSKLAKKQQRYQQKTM